MSIEAMKQALEALGIEREWQDGPVPHLDAAIAALRAAIEQAGKPVAWIQRNHLEHAQREPSMCRVEPTKRLPDFVPLYAAPSQWVGLTDEEISEARDTAAVEFRKNQYRVRGQMFMPSDSLEWWLARAVETKLKQKNA